MKIVFPSRESYEHIPEWLLEAQRHIAPHQATLLLVGCKHDLASQGNYIAPHQATLPLVGCKHDLASQGNLANHHGILFLET